MSDIDLDAAAGEPVLAEGNALPAATEGAEGPAPSDAAAAAGDPLAELTIHTAAARREALMALAAAAEGAELALDLSNTTEFDSAGVQLLFALRRTLAAGGRRLNIVQASPTVTAVLDTYHLDVHSLAPCQAH